MPKIKLIDPNTFPTMICTNCFGFAIGDTESLDSLTSKMKFNLNHSLPIAEAVIEKFVELHYDLPRQINNLDDALPGEVVLLFFNFTPYHVYNPFIEEYETHWDFHVVRRELDGVTWVHKPGWNEPPCAITSREQWKEICEEFGHEYVLFAAVV